MLTLPCIFRYFKVMILSNYYSQSLLALKLLWYIIFALDVFPRNNIKRNFECSINLYYICITLVQEKRDRENQSKSLDQTNNNIILPIFAIQAFWISYLTLAFRKNKADKINSHWIFIWSEYVLAIIMKIAIDHIIFNRTLNKICFSIDH